MIFAANGSISPAGIWLFGNGWLGLLAGSRSVSGLPLDWQPAEASALKSPVSAAGVDSVGRETVDLVRLLRAAPARGVESKGWRRRSSRETAAA